MSQNKEIKTMLETVETVFNATHTALSSMQDGERTSLKDLAKTVGLSVSLDPKQVLKFVDHFVHNTTVAYVARGQNGGIVKGVKTAKTVKPAKKVVKSDDSDNS